MINAKHYEAGLYLDDTGRLFRECPTGGIEYCLKAEYDAMVEALRADYPDMDITQHVRFYHHIAKHVAVIDPRGIGAIIK